jgi:hypothetical protein
VLHLILQVALDHRAVERIQARGGDADTDLSFSGFRNRDLDDGTGCPELLESERRASIPPSGRTRLTTLDPTTAFLRTTISDGVTTASP